MATEAVHPFEADALPLHRLDVETYDHLVESGALEGLEVELIEGLVQSKHSRGEDPVHRFDVRTFERMVATGALDGRPVELLDGLLVEVSPQGPAHAGVIEELTGRLSSARGRLRVQLPLEVGARSLPEPDLALVERPTPRDRHPDNAVLAVEVAVTSQGMNSRVKARMYASAGVPTYWLVDVPARRIEVRTDPGPDGYRRCDTYGTGEYLPSAAEGVPDLPVDSLFT